MLSIIKTEPAQPLHRLPYGAPPLGAPTGLSYRGLSSYYGWYLKIKAGEPPITGPPTGGTQTALR
jgi:hypothetical protein